MNEDEAARRLVKIGSALLRSKPYASYRTLLVAEVAADRAAVSIYKEVGGKTVYVFPTIDDVARRQAVVRAFGDRPVLYPPAMTHSI